MAELQRTAELMEEKGSREKEQLQVRILRGAPKQELGAQIQAEQCKRSIVKTLQY